MISIREKTRPFSHHVNTRSPLPGTNLVVQGSPEKIVIGDLEVVLGHDPYLPFTQILDLERNCVWISGKGFRVKVFAVASGIYVGERFFSHEHSFHLPKNIERLSFGVHKAQDWEMVLRRMDMKEILPVVYHLSQKVPKEEEAGRFEYRSFFEEMLVPQKGLHSAFTEIRSQFVQEEEKELTLLPNSPFTAGRMTNVKTSFGFVDMLWVKGSLQKVTLHIKQLEDLVLKLPMGVKTFRIKEHLAERGRVVKVGELMKLSPGTLYLDRFYT